MIELSAGAARATIATMGAELQAWRVGGEDLLWSPDPAWWAKSSPVLFPIVGWARAGQILVDGVRRPMGVHGFAADAEFTLDQQTAETARLTLRETPASLAAYPFPFRLTLTYRLAEDRLAVAFEVENAGARPMPYALGLHPGFRWPLAGLARDGHAVVFEKPERPEVPVIVPGGLFGRDRRPVPIEGRRLALNDAVFAQEALCFLDAASRSLTFEASPGGTAITLEAENFPHFAIWSKPGAPFVSLEAWTGHGDPEGFGGELADKPSIRLLAPGVVDTCKVTLVFRPGRR
jgi:galactose mutarotase-like enzyme